MYSIVQYPSLILNIKYAMRVQLLLSMWWKLYNNQVHHACYVADILCCCVQFIPFRGELYRHSKLEITKFSFWHRIVSPWNSLPEAILSAPTWNTFKNRLDKILGQNQRKIWFWSLLKTYLPNWNNRWSRCDHRGLTTCNRYLLRYHKVRYTIICSLLSAKYVKTTNGALFFI